MLPLDNEIDFFPYAFNCVCGRPLLVKASEQGREITCEACQHANGPFQLKKKERTDATANKLSVPDCQMGELATLTGGSDVTPVFQSRPWVTQWVKRLVVLVIAAVLTYAVYPFFIREPKVYGIGGMRDRLYDMFELIEWDENRILATMIVVLIIIIGFMVKAASSDPRPLPGVLLGGLLAFGVTASCLSLALVSMAHHDSLVMSVAVPYMKLINMTITKEFGNRNWLITFLFLLSCTANSLAGCFLGYLFSNRKARMVGGIGLSLISSLPLIQSLTMFASGKMGDGLEWFILTAIFLSLGVSLLFASRSPSKIPNGKSPSV